MAFLGGRFFGRVFFFVVCVGLRGALHVERARRYAHRGMSMTPYGSRVPQSPSVLNLMLGGVSNSRAAQKWESSVGGLDRGRLARRLSL